MRAQKDIQTIIKSVFKSYQEVYGKDLVKVILYGSYARGNFDKYSDIDLVAIVNVERQKADEYLSKVWDVSSELGLKYEIIISPTVIPYDDFMKYKDDLPYYRNIYKEGVEISA